jgi:hypothetical protein
MAARYDKTVFLQSAIDEDFSINGAHCGLAAAPDRASSV